MSNTKNRYIGNAYEKWNAMLNRLFYGKTPKERLITVFVCVIYAIVSAAFAKTTLPYTALSVGLPLCDALLLTVNAGAPGAYIGAIYGAYVSGAARFSRYFTILIFFALRITVSVFISEKDKMLFSESPLIKTGYSALMAMLQCAFHLSENGIYDGIWTRLFGTLTALPIITVAISFFFSGCPVKKIGRSSSFQRLVYEVSMTLFFMAVVFSFKGERFAGCSLSSLTVFLLTLITASKGGFFRGLITGAVLGYVYLPSLTLAYMATGAAAGLFFCLGALPAAGISVFLGCSVALWQNGFLVFGGFVPEAIIATAIASPIIRYSFLPEFFPYPKNDFSEEYKNLNEAQSRAMQNVRQYERILKLSDTFRELSGSIEKINKNTESNTEINKICTSLCRDFCDSCALNSICWETENKKSTRSVENIINSFKSGFSEKQIASPDYLSEYCIKFKELREEIRKIYPETEIRETEKTVGTEIIASDYRTVADILSDAVNEAKTSYVRDPDTEKAIMKVANAMGIKYDVIFVMGAKRKRIYIYGENLPKRVEDIEKIQDGFSEACKTELSFDGFSDDGDSYMVFSPAATLNAASYCLKSTKPGEVCSGDHAFSFNISDEYFYAILADGMGSGTEAAKCSHITASILEKLMRCNIRKSIATEILGDILRRRDDECFTTVDMMELDLVSGDASFLKSGAAASYIVRNGGVYCINACSMPIGITKEATPEEMSFNLKEGDTVIMLSDGIASDISDGSWIASTICGGFSSNEELAAKIMKKAKEINKQTDDMTVFVISINKREKTEEKKEA